MRLTLITIVMSTLRIIPNGLEIDVLVETIKTTALLRSARILRAVQEPRGDLLSLSKLLLV